MDFPDFPSSRKERTDAGFALMTAAVFAGLFLIVPLSIALAVVLLTARRLRWFEAAALASATGVAFGLGAENYVRAYGQWVGSFAGLGPAARGDVPFVGILLAGLTMGFLFAAMQRTRLFGSFSTGIGRVQSRMSFRKKDDAEEFADEGTGIIPSEARRQQLRSVIPPGTSLTVDPGMHSPDNAAVAGKRDFPIGIDGSGRPVMLNESEVRYHGLIFGSTGSGKTVTIQSVMAGLLDLGWSGVVLDLKEDTQTGGFRDWCREYASHHALPYQEIYTSQANPDYWFSPLHGLSVDKARDAIMSMQDFEAAYYKALNEKQLGQLLTLMFAANEIDPTRYPTPTIYDVGKILSAADVPAATKAMVALVIENAPGYTKDDFDSLIRPDKAMTEASGGLGARLTAMYESEVGRRMLRPGSSRLDFDVTRPGISYIGLDSLGTKELSKVVSTAVLLRMSAFASDRIQGRVPMNLVEGTSVPTDRRFLIVDEANFVDRMIILNLLSRARSAWMPVFLCTQGPTDWKARKPGDPDLTALLQNTNVNLIMNQGDRENAEICADIIGREEKTEIGQTYRQGIDEGELLGMTTSVRKDVTWTVDPEQLRALGIGELVTRISKPNVRTEFAQVVPRDPKASPRR